MANILYRGSTPSAANTSSGGVTRPLTNDEIDKNFYALNTSKLESGDPTLATVTTNGSSTSVNLTLSGSNTIGAISRSTTVLGTLVTASIRPNNSGFDIKGADITGDSGFSSIISGSDRTQAGAASDGGGPLTVKGGELLAGDGTFNSGGDLYLYGGNLSTSFGTGGSVHIVSGSHNNNISGTKVSGDVLIDVAKAGFNMAYTKGQIKIGTGGAFRAGSSADDTGVTVTIGTSTGQLIANSPITSAASSNTSNTTTIRTGDGTSTSGNIIIAAGTANPTSSAQTATGGQVHIFGGRALGTSGFSRNGGGVFIDGGVSLRIAGAYNSSNGYVYIGTKPGALETSSLLREQAGTSVVYIGHNGVSAGNVSIAACQTIIDGKVQFNAITDFNNYASFTAYPLYFGDHLIAGAAGALYDNSLNDFSIAFGVKDPNAANVVSTTGDVYSTRIVTGLSTGMGGHLFKFQRNTDATKSANTTITFTDWVDALSISNTGNLRAQLNIYAGGDIYAFSTSDQSLKTNIVRIDSALAKVNSLDGVTFNWNEDAKEKYEKDVDVRDVGVIAQQVQAVLPEVVKTREDGTLAVDYSKMVPLLIEAIKELTSQVKDLQNQLMNK
jgi:hypothetical protein